MKHLLLAIISLLSFANSFAQSKEYNLRIDGGSLAHNSAILSIVLLNIYGEEKVAEWLDNGALLHFHVFIDHKGSITKYKLGYSKNIVFTKKDVKKTFKYTKKHDIRFCLPIEDNLGLGLDRVRELLDQETEKGRELDFFIGFPGYGYQRQKYMKLQKEDEPNVDNADILKRAIEEDIKMTPHESLMYFKYKRTR